MISRALAVTGDSDRRMMLTEYSLVFAQREGVRRRLRQPPLRNVRSTQLWETTDNFERTGKGAALR